MCIHLEAPRGNKRFSIIASKTIYLTTIYQVNCPIPRSFYVYAKAVSVETRRVVLVVCILQYLLYVLARNRLLYARFHRFHRCKVYTIRVELLLIKHLN